MQRNLSVLTDKEYDLVIIGGGIFGTSAAWDATLRGLSVALVERGDFCQATSANHFKVVHGGIRYLQHLDFHRVRESNKERNLLLRIAPHLVQPLPIVIPTYGHGIKGKELLAPGLFLYDVLTADRNWRIKDPNRQIPKTRIISRREIVDLFPGIDQANLTGGAIFYDGQMYNPPRLALSFLRSAVQSGAEAANYAEATGFLQDENRIFGIKARDVLGHNELEIRGRIVLNTAGPWAHRLLAQGLGLKIKPKPMFSRDLALVVKRRPENKYGIAFTTRTRDADSVLGRGGRHLFALPWRESTLIGVWHKRFDRRPEEITVTERELQAFIDEVNEANPCLNLQIDDISMVNTGLTLFGDNDGQEPQKMSFGKRSRLIDHKCQHNLEGLVTLIGVRATTAQAMAEKAVDLVLKKLGGKGPKSRASTIPIYGGDIETFEKYLHQALAQHSEFDALVMRALIRNYGSRYYKVLECIGGEQTATETLGGSSVLKAEVVHAVREEMAQRLSDVVFRRTDLGTAGHPGEDALSSCANLMASEMGWNKDQKALELNEVRKVFPPFNKKYLVQE